MFSSLLNNDEILVWRFFGRTFTFGTDDNDTLQGDDGKDWMFGGAGDDFLFGGGGNDWLFGGEGNDRLDGGAGRDVMAGGSGNDVYFVDDSDDVVFETADNGHDIVYATADFQLGNNVEFLFLSGGATTGTGNALDNLIIANVNLANTLDGGAGNDILQGGNHDDWLLGGAGDDILAGHHGDDHLEGGSGNDELNGGAGVNLLDGGAGDDVLYGSGADTLVGGSGDDHYFLGDVSETVIELANGGVDTVFVIGSYALGAHLENLVLHTSSGIEATGNNLDNVITGNVNDNILTGRGGRDIFVFDHRSGQDLVTDFTNGEDRLQFSPTAATDFSDLILTMDNQTDLRISVGDTHVILENITLAQIDASDFIFA